MKSQLDEEKELLMMKGEALRMKLESLSSPKKKTVQNESNLLSLVSNVLEQPIVRSLALSLLSRKLLTPRNLLWSSLGIATVFLLNKPKQSEDNQE